MIDISGERMRGSRSSRNRCGRGGINSSEDSCGLGEAIVLWKVEAGDGGIGIVSPGVKARPIV